MSRGRADPKPVTLGLLYESIGNLGRIFGVEDRADALVASMEGTVEAVTASVDGEEPVSVFLYDSEEDTPYTVGGLGMANAIIEAAGARTSSPTSTTSTPPWPGRRYSPATRRSS